MGVIFILLFACSTWSNITLTDSGMGITQGWRLVDEHPTCVSEIKVLKSEDEVLDYMNSTIGKELTVNLFTVGERTPSRIYRYDKTGLKEVKVDPVYDVKQKTVEEKTLKGYQIK